MYDLPKPPAETTVYERAESPEFVAEITRVAQAGGGRVTAPRMELCHLPQFWTAVANRLPPEWRLEETGVRDMGTCRNLVPNR